MRRREFLKASGAAAIVLPWPAFAQKDLPLVAVLTPGPADLAKSRLEAISKGMREAGLVEGANFIFALRYADGAPVAGRPGSNRSGSL
jgi:putative tryptophan/tyrosine transport system substrate-binding protein